MGKKTGKERVINQDVELVFYGETLDNPRKIKKEALLFLKWYLKQTHENPDLKLIDAIYSFAETRPWGKDKYTLASDLNALKFAFLSIFDNPDIPSYKDEISKTSFGKRLELYQEIQSRSKNIKYISEKQFLEIVKLQSKWDNSFGAKWEKLNKTNFTVKQFKDFLDKAEKPYKQLKEACGTKICEAHDCMNALPIGSRKDKKYCSEKCRGSDKSRRWRNDNPDKKADANKKYWTEVKHKEDGITKEDYRILLKVKKDRQEKES